MFSAECEEKGETPEGIVFYPVALEIWHFDESIPRSNIFQTILQIAVSNFWFLDFKLFFCRRFWYTELLLNISQPNLVVIFNTPSSSLQMLDICHNMATLKRTRVATKD